MVGNLRRILRNISRPTRWTDAASVAHPDTAFAQGLFRPKADTQKPIAEVQSSPLRRLSVVGSRRSRQGCGEFDEPVSAPGAVNIQIHGQVI